jgi:hypothetical protein
MEIFLQIGKGGEKIYFIFGSSGTITHKLIVVKQSIKTRNNDFSQTEKKSTLQIF